MEGGVLRIPRGSPDSWAPSCGCLLQSRGVVENWQTLSGRIALGAPVLRD